MRRPSIQRRTLLALMGASPLLAFGAGAQPVRRLRVGLALGLSIPESIMVRADEVVE